MAHMHQLVFSCPGIAAAVAMMSGESTAITENGLLHQVLRNNNY